MQDVAIRGIVTQENCFLSLLSHKDALGHVVPDHRLHALFQALD